MLHASIFHQKMHLPLLCVRCCFHFCSVYICRLLVQFSAINFICEAWHTQKICHSLALLLASLSALRTVVNFWFFICLGPLKCYTILSLNKYHIRYAIMHNSFLLRSGFLFIHFFIHQEPTCFVLFFPLPPSTTTCMMLCINVFLSAFCKFCIFNSVCPSK